MLYGDAPNRLAPYGEYVEAALLTTALRLSGREGRLGPAVAVEGDDAAAAAAVDVGEDPVMVAAAGAVAAGLEVGTVAGLLLAHVFVSIVSRVSGKGFLAYRS